MNSSGKIITENLSAKVYGRIRQALMDGRYSPGAYLRLSPTAQEFGTSVTPVREAVLRLVGENVLEMKTATAFYVPYLMADRLKEMQMIRTLLEGEGAARAAVFCTKADVARLETLQERFVSAGDHDPIKASQINRQFHFALLGLGQLPMAIQIVENMWAMMGPLLRVYHSTVPKRMLTSGKHGHWKVISALRKHDAEGARAAIQADIATGSILVDWVKQHHAATPLRGSGASQSESRRHVLE